MVMATQPWQESLAQAIHKGGGSGGKTRIHLSMSLHEISWAHEHIHLSLGQRQGTILA